MTVKYNFETAKVDCAVFFKKLFEDGQNMSLVDQKSYVVFAVEFNEFGSSSYFLIDGKGSIVPSSYPSELFEVTDTRVSKFWKSAKGISFKFENKYKSILFTFKEWRDDEFFHWKMFENLNNANYIFDKYKKEMELEFNNWDCPIAYKIDDNIFLCINCDSNCVISDENEMFKCESCHCIQNKECKKQ